MNNLTEHGHNPPPKNELKPGIIPPPPKPLFSSVEIPDEYEKLAKVATRATKVYESLKSWHMFEVENGEKHDLLRELGEALREGGYLDG